MLKILQKPFQYDNSNVYQEKQELLQDQQLSLQHSGWSAENMMMMMMTVTMMMTMITMTTMTMMITINNDAFTAALRVVS